jgi:hypothetical protein
VHAAFKPAGVAENQQFPAELAVQALLLILRTVTHGKERNVETRDMWRRLWQPPGETLEAITAVLRSHWRAAGERTRELFWPNPGSWLHPQKARAGTHHLASGGRLIR